MGSFGFPLNTRFMESKGKKHFSKEKEERIFSESEKN